MLKDRFHWKSLTPDIATITPEGIVTPIGKGEATFAIFVGDKKIKETTVEIKETHQFVHYDAVSLSFIPMSVVESDSFNFSKLTPMSLSYSDSFNFSKLMAMSKVETDKLNLVI